VAPRGVPTGSLLAGSPPQFALFTDVSIPSPAMIAYAALYLLAVVEIAVCHFHQRDL
jgi:hypothetical protein